MNSTQPGLKKMPILTKLSMPSHMLSSLLPTSTLDLADSSKWRKNSELSLLNSKRTKINCQRDLRFTHQSSTLLCKSLITKNLEQFLKTSSISSETSKDCCKMPETRLKLSRPPDKISGTMRKLILLTKETQPSPEETSSKLTSQTIMPLLLSSRRPKSSLTNSMSTTEVSMMPRLNTAIKNRLTMTLQALSDPMNLMS